MFSNLKKVYSILTRFISLTKKCVETLCCFTIPYDSLKIMSLDSFSHKANHLVVFNAGVSDGNIPLTSPNNGGGKFYPPFTFFCNSLFYSNLIFAYCNLKYTTNNYKKMLTVFLYNLVHVTKVKSLVNMASKEAKSFLS